VHQFKQIIVVDILVKLSRNGFEFLEVNYAIFILIKNSKDFFKSVLCFGFSNFGTDAVQELIEVDGFILVSEGSDETENEWISFIKTEFIHNFVDFSWVYGSTSVLIKNLKSLFEFIVVFSTYSVFPGELSSWRCSFSSWWGLSLRSSAHKIYRIIQPPNIFKLVLNLNSISKYKPISSGLTITSQQCTHLPLFFHPE